MAQKQHDAQRGDLIEFYHGEYQHWAVYIGNDEVVHVTLPEHGSTAYLSTHISSTKATVARESIWKVAGNDDFRVNNLLDEKYKPLDVNDTVINVCKMVGQDWEYNVVTNNCEHFASEMRYGKAESRQVRKVIVAAVVTIVVIIAILWYVGPLVFTRREIIASVI